jgi:hypothetical protein
VHHQGGIDEEGLNGDMKSQHRDPLNTKRFFLLKNYNACLLSGTKTLRQRVLGRHLGNLVVRPSQN